MERLLATLLPSLLAAGCVVVGGEGAPATPQRPTLSNATTTTAAGTFEIEAGVLADPGDVYAAAATLKYGLDERTEGFLGGSPLVHVEQPGEDETGIGDVVLGARHRFLDEGTRPSFAVQGSLKLPTASESRGLGTGEVDAALAGILTKDVEGHVFTGYAEVQALGESDDSGHDLGQVLALAVTAPARGRVSPFAEIAAVGIHEQDLEPVFVTLGLAWAVRADLVLDAGIVVGLNDDAPDAQLVIGLTRNLGRPRR